MSFLRTGGERRAGSHPSPTQETSALDRQPCPGHCRAGVFASRKLAGLLQMSLVLGGEEREDPSSQKTQLQKEILDAPCKSHCLRKPRGDVGVCVSGNQAGRCQSFLQETLSLVQIWQVEHKLLPQSSLSFPWSVNETKSSLLLYQILIACPPTPEWREAPEEADIMIQTAPRTPGRPEDPD